MKYRRILLLLLFVFCLSSSLQAAEPPLAKLELNEGDTIVFLGDSITHQRLYTQYVEDFFFTRYPNKRLNFHNAGVGGAQAWDALERFGPDVAAYRPKYVTVLLGMNDGRYVPFNQENFDRYHKGMTEVVRQIRECGATPILMTPTMYDSRAARARKKSSPAERLEQYNAVLAYYGYWLREVAVESGAGFVDMHSLLNNLTLQQRKTDPDFTMIPDAVHPGPAGQFVMAYAILQDMDVDRIVSSAMVNLNVGKKKKSRANAKRGTITDLKVDGNTVQFTWLAESLPFVVPAEAEVGVKLTKVGHRYGKEVLKVLGLKRGKYELKIDGTVVGTYPDNRLVRGLEIQANSKTPQYQQALAVAEMNKKRNGGPVARIRSRWHRFQTFARVRKQVQDDPDNKELASKLAELQSTVEGMEAAIRKDEEESSKMVDEIYKASQPQPHTYELTLVK